MTKQQFSSLVLLICLVRGQKIHAFGNSFIFLGGSCSFEASDGQGFPLDYTRQDTPHELHPTPAEEGAGHRSTRGDPFIMGLHPSLEVVPQVTEVTALEDIIVIVPSLLQLLATNLRFWTVIHFVLVFLIIKVRIFHGDKSIF